MKTRGSWRRQAERPSGGWASRSRITTRPVKPRSRMAAMATATSLTGQKPPATLGVAWWKPPSRLRAGSPVRSVSRVAPSVPPAARRMVSISSSTRRSAGSAPKTLASPSGRLSDSSSSGVWTRESRCTAMRVGARSPLGEMTPVPVSHQAAKSARRGSRPTLASSPPSGSR